MLERRKILFQWVKIIISAGLIILLIWKISPAKISRYIKDIDPFLLTAALLIFLLSSFLGAVQWYILLKKSELNLSFSKVLNLYFVGLFFNNFLPANVGGDAYKIFDVSRMGNDPYKVFAITLLDRIFGIFGLCILALVSSLILLPSGDIGNIRIYILFFAAIVGGILILMLNRRLARLLRKILTRIKLWNIGERLDLIFNQLGGLRDIKFLMTKIVLLTLSIQFLRIMTHVIVGKSIGMEMSIWIYLYFFVFVPLLGIIMILPVSINGLGVREGAGVLLFTSVGILAEQALLVEFLTYTVMVTVSLSGGILFLRRNIGRR